MDLVKLAADLVAGLALNPTLRGQAELLKMQLEAMQRELAAKDAKIRDLEAELERLGEHYAGAVLDEEFEHRGPFVYKKGNDNPLCPICKTQLSKRLTYYSCPATNCKWGYDDGPGNLFQTRVRR